MRTAKRTICALVMAALMLALLGTPAFATENGNVWLFVTNAEGGNTAVSVVADAPVSDAYVEVTFDSGILTYANIEVDSQYVEVYSLNADEAGLVKLAWVSKGNYDAGEGVALLTLTFIGSGDETVAMSGQLRDAAGNALAIGETVRENVDKTELTKAVLVAQGLQAENYTEESFAAFTAVLAEAKAVLEDEAATQDAVDALTLALNDAMEALVLVSSSVDEEVNVDALAKLILKAEGLQKIMYSEESFAAMEAALAAGKEVLNNAGHTKEMVDAAAENLRAAIEALVLISGDAPNTGASFLTAPMALLLVLSAAGIVAVIILLNSKKGRCAK